MKRHSTTSLAVLNERRNGIVIVPHSKAELRAGLVDAFGEQTIRDWETLGKARAKR